MIHRTKFRPQMSQMEQLVLGFRPRPPLFIVSEYDWECLSMSSHDSSLFCGYYYIVTSLELNKTEKYIKGLFLR